MTSPRRSGRAAKPNKQRAQQAAAAQNSHTTLTEDEESDGESVTRCVCAEQHHDGTMVCCDSCEVWQHCQCVGLADPESVEEYYCEECRPEYHRSLRTSHGRNKRIYDPSGHANSTSPTTPKTPSAQRHSSTSSNTSNPSSTNPPSMITVATRPITTPKKRTTNNSAATDPAPPAFLASEKGRPHGTRASSSSSASAGEESSSRTGPRSSKRRRGEPDGDTVNDEIEATSSNESVADERPRRSSMGSSRSSAKGSGRKEGNLTERSNGVKRSREGSSDDANDDIDGSEKKRKVDDVFNRRSPVNAEDRKKDDGDEMGESDNGRHKKKDGRTEKSSNGSGRNGTSSYATYLNANGNNSDVSDGKPTRKLSPSSTKRKSLANKRGHSSSSGSGSNSNNHLRPSPRANSRTSTPQPGHSENEYGRHYNTYSGHAMERTSSGRGNHHHGNHHEERERGSSPPARVKMPTPKMSISEMNKRARHILEFISRLQVEMAEKKGACKPAPDDKDKTDKDMIVVDNTVVAVVTTDNTTTSSIISAELKYEPSTTPDSASVEVSSQSLNIPNATATTVITDALLTFSPVSELSQPNQPTSPSSNANPIPTVQRENSTSLDLMDRLTRELIKFQKRFGAAVVANAGSTGTLPSHGHATRGRGRAEEAEKERERERAAVEARVKEKEKEREREREKERERERERERTRKEAQAVAAVAATTPIPTVTTTTASSTTITLNPITTEVAAHGLGKEEHDVLGALLGLANSGATGSSAVASAVQASTAVMVGGGVRRSERRR